MKKTPLSGQTDSGRPIDSMGTALGDGIVLPQLARALKQLLFIGSIFHEVEDVLSVVYK